MKNATKHADQLKTLCRRLIKDQKPAERQSMDPLKAMVRAALSFDVDEARVDEAMVTIDREFCDYNELRVATELEVQAMLGGKYPQLEKRVGLLTQILNAIFEREHTLSLDRLKTVSKKDARQFLKDLPEMHPFVEAYVVLYGFDGSAVPLDETMLQYLRDEGIVEQETTLEEVQRFVEHHLKAEDFHAFFAALRSAATDTSKGKKKAKA